MIPRQDERMDLRNTRSVSCLKGHKLSGWIA